MQYDHRIVYIVSYFFSCYDESMLDVYLSSKSSNDMWLLDASASKHCNRVFTRSSKRPALHLLEVCWTFVESCKHPITFS